MNQPKASQQLQVAFEQFNELSEQLQDTYQILQDRVASLTRELYAARSERLKQLAEKEQLAERLGALLDTLPGGVVVLDGQGVIREVNPAAEKILGHTLPGKRWLEVVPQTVNFLQDCHDVVLPNAKVINISSRTLESNGGLILLLQDVTETRVLQDQVNRQERLSAMGEMTAQLAHQIRTPLATALLYASHLNKPQSSQEQHILSSQQLLACLHNLDQMINDMLVFSRGGNSGDELITPAELVEQVHRSLAPQLSAAGAAWQVVNEDKSARIFGNPVSLISALTNLAANALSACGDNACLVWKVMRDKNTVVLSLSDNGPGIPDQLSTQIFEPFFTTRTSGTGLGLPVVRAVIEAHGGSVKLDKTAGAGACFVIKIPVAPPQQMPSNLQAGACKENLSQRRSA